MGRDTAKIRKMELFPNKKKDLGKFLGENRTYLKWKPSNNEFNFPEKSKDIFPAFVKSPIKCFYQTNTTFKPIITKHFNNMKSMNSTQRINSIYIDHACINLQTKWRDITDLFGYIQKLLGCDLQPNFQFSS